MVPKFIRSRAEERTCYQESSKYSGAIDFGHDMTCVYGVDPGMPDRVRQFRERGYVIHLMTGIAWGNYRDYLDGKWDGRDHRDEVQRDREGKVSGHWIHDDGYIVSAISFTDYLTERLKVAVDAGVEAIHVEEPEFLGSGGYSEAFKREYLLYYREQWSPPHSCADAYYKAASLKAYLYRRAIERISAELRDYALVKYGRVLRFYVPTHSLINYAQWNVMSPEGTLTDVPSLDGYKAQVWMGTCREPNVYKGIYKERTFETAFLEYGVMQELVRGTGRDMWFDNDPIEDDPRYGWGDYRVNYIKTLVGSLLQPHINRFQICPWPTRIFGPNAKYPKPHRIFGYTENRPQTAEPTFIPADYATLLCNVFQTQGTFETDDFSFDRQFPQTGVFISDSAMFQRRYPDDVRDAFSEKYAGTAGFEKLTEINKFYQGDLGVKTGGKLSFADYAESAAFPYFYGLALPLLKGGLPIRPVQLENITRYPSYLDDYKLLILSYEFMKPASAGINGALAAYVQNGGVLCYVGDGGDPFHNIRAWWNTGKINDPTPLEHLLRLLGLPAGAGDGVYECGAGRFALYRANPAALCLNAEASDAYRNRVASLLGVALDKNNIVLRRGAYVAAAVMDECESDEPVTFNGLFVDMLTPEFDVVHTKTIGPDEYALLLDLSKFEDENLFVAGTSVRINSLGAEGAPDSGAPANADAGAGKIILTACGPDNIRANIRLRLPKKITGAECRLTPVTPADGAAAKDKQIFTTGPSQNLPVAYVWDDESRTALLSYDSAAGDVEIRIK